MKIFILILAMGDGYTKDKINTKKFTDLYTIYSE